MKPTKSIPYMKEKGKSEMDFLYLQMKKTRSN